MKKRNPDVITTVGTGGLDMVLLKGKSGGAREVRITIRHVDQVTMAITDLEYMIAALRREAHKADMGQSS